MKEHYTVKEIAELLGISTQAVYKKIKAKEQEIENQLETNLCNQDNQLMQPQYKVRKGKQTLYTCAFIRLLGIIEQEEDNQLETNLCNQDNQLNQPKQPTYATKPTEQTNQNNLDLSSALEVLKLQLIEKDIQIKELNERLKEANELNRNNQILLLNAKEEIALIKATEQEPQKKAWYKRLFKKEV